MPILLWRMTNGQCPDSPLCESITIRSDSQLAVEQLNRRRKVRDRELKAIWTECQDRLRTLQRRGCTVNLNFVRREHNRQLTSFAIRHSTPPSTDHQIADTCKTTPNKKETTMPKKSRGEVRLSPLFNANELGILVPEPHPNRAIQIFLDVASPAGGTAIAPRVTQMPKAVLLLQSVEGVAACGAIYLYIRETGDFYMVDFDAGDNDNLTTREYEDLVLEYGLIEYAACPELVYKPPLPPAGMA